MEYGDPSADIVEARAPSRSTARRLDTSPHLEAACFVPEELDDGNGMWIFVPKTP
jgi:hypothetical protein